MNKLRCIAIDDEPFALEILADDIAKVPFLELVGTFSSPLDAVSTLQNEAVDLLFLDIQMPTLTGMQFLRTLDRPPMVILTTAFEQYALEGYELSVVDYLLKPIPFDRFLKAVTKALSLYQLRHAAVPGHPEVAAPAETAEAPTGPTTDHFFIFTEYREVKIYFSEVLYVEGLKDYVKIFTTQQSLPFLSRLSLKAVESRLPARDFCRVHRSFIVALNKITSFQRTRLFIGKQEIPVGSNYYDEFSLRYRA
ncbi:LytR/AlgR family response regulator transcription factor [Tellurirhabdus rosea]|uniref:LytR/AlgR family response regulator transcription factor n=1 Tax=Tellurirhabdus rosea TaxID=2674997 RepID=UPI00225896DF|nr:LytTR family DNA-binding domain-containing protein [Tellurirhabdus rosea]